MDALDPRGRRAAAHRVAAWSFENAGAARRMLGAHLGMDASTLEEFGDASQSGVELDALTP
jgi:hypothetical protein